MVNRISLTLFTLALIVVGLELLGYFFPTSLTWGCHFFGFLPPWMIGCAVFLVLLAVVLVGRSDPDPLIRRLSGYSERHAGLFAGILIAMTIGAAALFRVDAPLLGDGFFLVKNFSDAFHGTAPLYFRNEPLATAYYWILFVAIGVPGTYREFLQGFFIADSILAIVFVLLSLAIFKILVNDPKARFLGILLVLVLPSMQLFFGYIETYAVECVALSLYILMGALFIRRGKSFALVTVAFLLMTLTHYMTIVLLPSLFYLAYREYRRRGWKSAATGIGIAAAVFFGILLAINFDLSPYSSSVPQHHYLSLAQPTDQVNADSQAYTLLSPFHLADLANLLILIGLPAVFLFVSRGHRRVTLDTEEKRFMATALVPVFFLLAIIKFDLGAARDWDVFAPYAFPLLLLAIMLVGEADDRRLVQAWILVLILSLVQSISFWQVNADKGATLARYDSILDTRTVSQSAYYAASLHLSQYHLQMNNDSLSSESWKRYNRIFPNDLRGYENLITSWTRGGHAKVEQITHAYEQWISHAPTDSALRLVYRNFCLNLGNAYFRNDELADAERFYVKAIGIDPLYPNAHNNLGSVYAHEGKIDSAITHFQRAITLNPYYGEAYYNLGNALADKGDADLARGNYKKAAQLNVPEAREILKEPKKVR